MFYAVTFADMEEDSSSEEEGRAPNIFKDSCVVKGKGCPYLML